MSTQVTEVEPGCDASIAARTFGYEMSDIVGFGWQTFQDLCYEHPGDGGLTIDLLNDMESGAAIPDNLPSVETVAAVMPGLISWWEQVQSQLESVWWPYDASAIAPGLEEAKSAGDRVGSALESLTVGSSFDRVFAMRELLRYYRRWTRSIGDMGRLGWPGIDWKSIDAIV